MKRALPLALAGAVLAASASAQPPPPRPTRYALLIGIDAANILDGQVETLRYAKQDALELAEVLERPEYGFRVTLLTDSQANRQGIVTNLLYHALTLRETDEFLLFYSGHGVRNSVINKHVYWLTFNAAFGGLDVNAVRIQHLMDYVREIKAQRKIILLDHCLSGEIVADLALASGGPPDGGTRGAEPARPQLKGAKIDLSELQETAATKGLVVISAARREALEHPTIKHGLFSYAVKEALTTRDADTAPADGRLSLTELITYLKTRVRALATQVGGGFEQKVEAYGDGSDLDEWILASTLPGPDIAQLRAKTDDYRRVLARWELQGYMSSRTRIRCNVAIENVVASLASGVPAKANDTSLYQTIESTVGQTGPDKPRADAITSLVDVIVAQEGAQP